MATPAQTPDPWDLAKAVPLIIGYHERWDAEMVNYEVLEVESEFHVPVVNPETGAASRTWDLGGKLDVLVREVVRDIRIVIDHKSTSEDCGPGSDYLKRLRIDAQISIYHDGARAFGQAIDHFMYDVIKKPGLRPLKATPVESRKYTKAGALYATQREQDETPEEYRNRIAEAIAANPNAYYQRPEIVRLEAEMDEARLDVWQLGRQMAESERLGRFPRNPEACAAYGRSCSFFGVCTGEASLLDPHLFTRSEVIHPELSASTERSLLTSSRLKTARACQRLHKYKYIDGYRPAAEAEALRFGSLLHTALEAWWKAKPEERLDAALDALTSTPAAANAA